MKFSVFLDVRSKALIHKRRRSNNGGGHCVRVPAGHAGRLLGRSGARGGNRTHTRLPSQDFKSWASTSSATLARKEVGYQSPKLRNSISLLLSDLFNYCLDNQEILYRRRRKMVSIPLVQYSFVLGIFLGKV